ncbi:KilA-N domain-containing protein [Burkholderia glumae]|uniref:KilA-N domain-containing protein n=1 Tax=Burkholderia glumae TaxID=337 RepID=UPI002151248E|nr:KilA-N domain-containing protein [Burkholderia glumae]
MNTMKDLIEIGGVEIHADERGRFSLNDLHRAAGGEDRHRPSRYAENQQAKDLAEEIGKAGFPALVSVKGGASPGTYACKEMVYAYAMWISAAFHLKVIRTFDAAVAGVRGPVTSAVNETIDAAKLFQPCFRIARLIGCDKQAAAISADQAVRAVVGVSVLGLLGQTHIEAGNQESLYFTPTELGKRIGTSARGMNLLLAEAGFQMKRGEHWEVAEAGKDFARIYDTGKRHGSGVPIQQIKWSVEVLPAIGKTTEAA